jgi:6-phosphofructokinase 1
LPETGYANRERFWLKKVGVVTSGGDAPGMNAAIRAVVRIAHSRGFQVYGFERGWEGLMTNTWRQLTPRSVGGIIQLGGTILYTSRCPEFETKQGIKQAAKSLASNSIDGLVVIGGDGSFKGALELSEETETLIVGVPASIDNDVFGTDETIGFDTAVNTAVDEIDKIRDTAISHERIFIVEVMGKMRGFLASVVGLTVGAEVILVPEAGVDRRKIVRMLLDNSAKGKRSGIIVAAEGIGDTRQLGAEIEKDMKTEVKLSVLGYAQRGGSPTARSRLLASLFAAKAVELLSKEQGNRVVGFQDGNTTSIDLEKSCRTEKPLDLSLLDLAKVLAI